MPPPPFFSPQNALDQEMHGVKVGQFDALPPNTRPRRSRRPAAPSRVDVGQQSAQPGMFVGVANPEPDVGLGPVVARPRMHHSPQADQLRRPVFLGW